MFDIRNLYENLFSSLKPSFSLPFQEYLKNKTTTQDIDLHPGVPYLYWLMNINVSLERIGTE
jgi:hypothetical protein